MSMRLKLAPLLTLGVLGLLAFSAAPALATPGYGFASAFGKEGPGAGEFTSPAGVAVNDATEDVYVVDKGNRRVEEFTADGTFIKEFTPTGGFSEPEEIAVDNSGSAPDTSKEDVYVTDVGDDVIDKFTATGEYLGQITGTSATGAGALTSGLTTIESVTTAMGAFSVGQEITAPGLPAGTTITAVDGGGVLEVSHIATKSESASLTAQGPFSGLDGVAVDTHGTVWVYEGSAEIDAFSDAEPNVLLSSRDSQVGRAESPGFAVDSDDDLYVVWRRRSVAKLNSAGVPENEEFGVESPTGIAVDLANNDVYLDAGGGIGEFSSTGSLLENFGTGGSGHLTNGNGVVVNGVAVNAATGTVYVADSAKDDVDIFMLGLGEAPNVGGEFSSELTRMGGVTLNARVNPNAQETTYGFEYSTEANGETLEGTIEKVPGATLPAGSTEQPVSAVVSGLAPLTTYYYRVVAENAASEREGKPVDGSIQSFATLGVPPLVSTGAASMIGQTSANVTGTIDRVGVVEPGGVETYYYYQYGPTTEYGQSTALTGPGIGIGSGLGAAEAPATLGPLVPGTTYHYRLVAWNEEGTSYGQDETFTTEAGQSPLAVTGSASGISVSEATLSGTVNPEGKETSYRFEYGTNTEYGTQAFGTVLPEQGEQTVTLSLRGLEAGTTYHYRLVVTNPGGTSVGQDETFTTPPISDPLVNPAVPPLIATPNIAFPREEKASGTTTKALTKAEKLKKALKACKKKRGAKRATCEKQAKKKYGTTKKQAPK